MPLQRIKSYLSLICLFVFFVFSIPAIKGQGYYTKNTAPEKAVNAYKKSRQLAFDGEGEKALKEAEKALKHAPGFIEAHYLIADINIGMGRNEAAITHFEKIIELAPDYKPRVYYSYGLFLYGIEKFERADEILTRFLTYPEKSATVTAKATRFRNNAAFAKTALENPVPFEPENLGGGVNSLFSEYWPSISLEGDKLIFTRNVGGNEDFFYSSLEDDNWGIAVNIGPPINTRDNEGAQTVSADGRFFAYTVCNREGDYGKCDIYFSEFIEGQWTVPQNIGPAINTARWESQPSLSADGKKLFFCRADEVSSDLKNIWVSEKNEAGQWQEAKRLSTVINTAYEEQAPFIHPDGKTLYFISNGHPGMGKGDIFLSRLQPDGTWGKPENIGYPINTSNEELGIIVDLKGEKAYYASNREGGVGKLDLYRFELPTDKRPKPVTFAKALVFDKETREPLIADVKVVDLGSTEIQTTSNTDESGSFIVCLPAGTDFALNVEKEGYAFHSEHFSLKAENTLQEPFVLEIGLIKIPVESVIEEETTKESAPIVLKNIFFDSGSAELLPASFPELETLKQMLKDNPDIRIRIKGHTDNVGADSDNQTLSDNRAKAVVDYLKSTGINPDRLESKGFGETVPVADNSTEEGRAENRRTEFVILH